MRGAGSAERGWLGRDTYQQAGLPRQLMSAAARAGGVWLGPALSAMGPWLVGQQAEARG